MALIPFDPTQPLPAGVWLITLLTAQGSPLLAGLAEDGSGLSPLGQVVASIWKGLAFDAPGVALGELAILPDGIRALLIVPWAGSVEAVGSTIDRFKSLVSSTARRAGLKLDSLLWRSDVTGQLIHDPLELAACRSSLKANLR